MLEYYIRNVEHFSEAMPDLPNDFFSLNFQINRSIHEEELSAAGKHYRFYLYLNESGEIVGDISISNISRESIKSCIIGYKTDKAYVRRGIMKEALMAVTKFIFRELLLHRIEAYVLPENQASIRLLEELHFEREGIARKFVIINGIWRDHERFALINDND